MPNFASLAPFFSCKRAGTLYDSQGYFGTLPRAKRVKLKWLHQTPQSNTAGHPMASPLPLAATRWRRRFGRLGKYHAPQSMLQSRLKSALPGPFIFCMISPTFCRIGPSNPFLSSHSTRLSKVGREGFQEYASTSRSSKHDWRGSNGTSLASATSLASKPGRSSVPSCTARARNWLKRVISCFASCTLAACR